MNAGDRPGMVGSVDLSSGAITPVTTPSTLELKNMIGRSLLIAITVTAKTGTPTSITPTIKGVLPDGTTYSILQGPAITGTGATLLRVSPDLTAAANSIAKDIVPRDIQITWSAVGVDGSNNFTFTVGAITGL